MSGEIGEAGAARIARGGVASLSDERGLELFDRALSGGEPVAAAMALDRSALGAQARAGTLHPLLAEIAPRVKAPARAGALATVPAAERERKLTELVRAEVAAVLGHEEVGAIDPAAAFKELGFDSLAAVELRNRLSAATGLRIASTAVFDYPNVTALAAHLTERMSGAAPAKTVARKVRSTEEPIAIVGMACRLPGGVSSPTDLWELVRKGRDAIGPLPTDRGWDPERVYVVHPDSPEYLREGGFLADAAEFDPAFFSISPREATEMDPQHRLALESSWEALEDAGIDPLGLRGSATGVFTGVMFHEYGVMEGEASLAAGAASSANAGRVSYTLGLEGPAMTVDTACSSSLVAIHLAAGALQRGECDLALAGGATVLAASSIFAYFSNQRGLAADGRSKAFSEQADGLGISEGVGVLALERLSDAEAKGHRILATIKGSAVNQDGASNGLTAPNGPSQERVIRQALANAGLEPSEIDMVEAHGTGTSLGDPIEAGAILATYGQDRDQPLRLGSLKSNIGHAQAAAGVSGVIKAVLAMRAGLMPKTLHVDQPSSKIDWETGKVELLTEAREWEAAARPRRAGVSSFGATGTNAHLILEEAPVAGRDPGTGASAKDLGGESSFPAGPLPLLVSAKDEQALAEQASRLVTYLEADPGLELSDLAYSLATTRAGLQRRAVLVAESGEELAEGLSALAKGERPPSAVLAKTPSSPRLAYLFTGQGSQRPGMGQGLYGTYPVYREALDQVFAEVDPLIGRSLAELIFSEEGSSEASELAHTTYAQPALFATQVALGRLYESWGLTPEAMAGHSVGEISAAHLAGVLSLKDAAKLVCSRGALMGALPEGGAMLAIEATETEALELIAGKESDLSLAAINSPSSCVISGVESAIDECEATWKEQGKRAKRLDVSHAFHSPLMEPMLEEFGEVCASLDFKAPKFPIVSCLTGELLTEEQATDPTYWVTHVRQPVRFAAAVATLLGEGATTALELGPDPVLCAMADECLGEDQELTLAPALRSGHPEPASALGALATAHATGAPVDWDAFFEGSGAKQVPLPTYPFQRQRYWLSQKGKGADPSAVGQNALSHPFLGASFEDPESEGLFLSGRISLAEQSWLSDHALGGQAILPGTAFLEAALYAGVEAGAPVVEELTLQAPLPLGDTPVALRVSLSASENGRREFSIHSRLEEEGAQWVKHAAGTLSEDALEEAESLAEWPPTGAESIDIDDLRSRLTEAGFDYGEAFQGLTAAWQGEGETWAEVALPEALGSEGFLIHPALLDAALHPVALAEGQEMRVPFSFAGIALTAAGPTRLRVRIAAAGEEARIELFDDLGAPLGLIEAAVGRPFDPAALSARTGAPLYSLRWERAELDEREDGEALSEERGEEELWRAPRGMGAKEATLVLLARLQDFLSTEEEGSRLAIVTRGAFAVDAAESPDPIQAALAGLAGSAASEHPGRVVLIDSDDSEPSEAVLRAALSGAEPQLALREGKALVPRLAKAEPSEGDAAKLDPERTVLITGATGGLGQLIARHLIERHGAGHLLLASRSGEEAEGATEMRDELEALGARVRIAACDVSDRFQVLELLMGIDPKHSLGAVIHCAAVLDDATVQSASAEQVERVFAPKVEGAQMLNELTRELELTHFVCFSSIAGLFGSPGQGAYAAANRYLDALAQRRNAEGLPATSIAWGLWRRESGMSGEIGEADAARIARGGVSPLSDEQGLELFDRALSGAEPLAAAVALNLAALRTKARSGTLPVLLAGIVPPEKAAATAAVGNFAALPAAERERKLSDLVRAEVASVLGHQGAAAVDPDAAFKELGFDSLAAVELRNRLNAATGLRLASTAVFDYPTARALASHLVERMSGAAPVKTVARKVRSSEEPIAIVGMACRLPGGVSKPQELWELLRAERDAIGSLPTDRGWDPESVYVHHPDGPDYRREGGFLADAAEFDPGFFSIAPREAEAMDPQQRLALESSWEALEDAGIDPLGLRGSATGVFTGVMFHEYGVVEGEASLAAGAASSGASGRVSYALGLEGPAMTVDTACSSSLVAIHLAAGALQRGECDLALAGGSTVLAAPSIFAYFSNQRGLAADGRSKSFSEAADGLGISEGGGVLVLERLSDAEAKGHRVVATIRGSAVNQDGASNGLTAPNGPSQERVILQALANAGLEPQEIDMVEAHGTGTALGDPIEAGAILATYGQDREQPLRLGSLKSNVGHAQAAAGVSGVIKAVLAMREGLMPKTLHVDSPSSKIDWETGKVELLTEAREWKANGHPRRAGVSSFGATGTNAHLILEEAPVAGRDPGTGASSKDQDGEDVFPAGPLPLLLSAKDEEALAEQASRLAIHVDENSELELGDLAYSLAKTRAGLQRRAVLLADDRAGLAEGLSALAKGERPPNAVLAKTPPSPRLAYLFTGQGSQRPGMGKELYETYPAYREALDQVFAEVDPLIARSLAELIFSEEGSSEAAELAHTTYAQPALFATQVALGRLYEGWGLKPEAMAGHSVGEISAAHLAGGLSLEDAAKLVCSRGALMGALPGGGAMLAIEATEAEALDLIGGKEHELSLAAINSPTSCVISGTESAINACEAAWKEQGKRAKRLDVSHAFHSPLMEPMLEEFAAVCEGLDFQAAKTPIVSCLTGELLTAEQATDPAYWVTHVRQPVRFAAAVSTLLGEGATTALELGPDPVLCAMADECLGEDQELTLAPALRSGHPEPQSALGALATAHATGAPVDWDAFFRGSGASTVPLPTYAFQRKRYWLSPQSKGADPAALGHTPLDHPFLAAAIEEPEGEALSLSGRISLAEHPWLSDHALAGQAILPGAAFLEAALYAGERAGAPVVEELLLQAPLAITDTPVALRISLSAPEEGRREFSIHSRLEGEDVQWTKHASGTLAEGDPTELESLSEWPPQGAEEIEIDDLRVRLAEAGFDYGEAFRGLTAAWQDGEEVYAEASLPEPFTGGGFLIHPALLDASLHPAVVAEEEEMSLPFSFAGISLAAPAQAGLRVRISGDGEQARIELFDDLGAPLGLVEQVTSRPFDPTALRAGAPDPLYTLSWRALSIPSGERGEAELWRAPEARSAKEATLALLARLQGFLATEEEGSRLAIVTRGAFAVDAAETPDPIQAALAGLAGSAASEHPGRVSLIDSDGSEASEAVLREALASTEAQVALREGKALVPRLAKAEPGEEDATKLDPERTVLITGASGGLGQLIAKHLIEHQGAEHLLLASRSGEEAEGATEMRKELEALGARVRIAACDVSDRSQVQELLADIDPEHPLGAVIHCAAVLDDATVQSAGTEQIERVFAPKVDGAAHLDELTRELELTHFVCFSSAAGLFGSPGQGAYAAANRYLDALAQQRSAEGLPATSIAWGLWRRESGMSGEIGEADAARIARGGVSTLSDERGLALFDRALESPEPLAAALALDRAALGARAKAGALHPLLAEIAPRVKAPAARASGALTVLPAIERERKLAELVRAEVAAVLGHEEAGAIDPAAAFKELGFDSLAAVELRNRLNAATGLRIASTAVFDYPNVAALAAHLAERMSGDAPARATRRRVRSSEEPIAIVGMACRLPGGVATPQELWDLVREGRDAVGPLPTDRGWDPEQIYVVRPDGPAYRREGGFLAAAAEFDPAFFSISPREATEMDPQQRLALESSWEALEDAGIDPLGLRGTEAGVFTGVMFHEYGVAGVDLAKAGGGASSAAAGRVSYTLGLEGPAMTIDTACSSSLVAIHLAAGALQRGECDLALAGGSTVLATPSVISYFSNQRGLAADGRSKAFSEQADGVGISEGAGVLVLERLSDAEAKGRRILATIKGTAVNQDGASNGLTAPNGPSQERVILQALANAGLEPSEIDMVEAHGTGTSLGDPIEAGALLATYGQDREQPLRLGSLKSNIGHAQAAAGVSGVIKTVMAMRAGTMPKTLHADQPSSRIDWEAGKVELLAEAREWEANGHPRRAGVSSFGATGTNAHLILEEAPVAGRDPGPGASAKDQGGEEGSSSAGPRPLLISAKGPEALAEQAARLIADIEESPELEPGDLAYSLATSRAHLEQRAVLTVEGREEILAGLDSLARGERPAGAALAKASASPRLAYLFTGQGSQRPGMGKELYETYPAYREGLDQVFAEIDPLIGRSLAELIFSEEGSSEAIELAHTTYAQSALFATQVALGCFYESWGLKPEAMTGHSVGEISAAHLAGVLSLKDAAKLVCSRGALMGALPEGGAMLAIEATEVEALDLITGRESELSLAAINSPSSCVISGAAAAIDECEAVWKGEGKRAKRLDVSHAFHSPLMEPMLEEFAEVCQSLELTAPQLPIVSCLTGELLTAEQATDPAYWVTHVRQPVRFAAAVATLLGEGTTTALELGPDPVLCAMADECMDEDQELTLAPALRSGHPEPKSALGALATAHATGVRVDWDTFFKGSGASTVPLHTYAFQRKRYWLSPQSRGADPAALGQAALSHPFFAAAIEEPEGEGLSLSGRISLVEHPWLADHAIGASPILPGTAFLEAALYAGERAGAPTVEELTLQAPLVLGETPVALRLSVSAPEEGRREFSIHSRLEEEGAQWVKHAAGTLSEDALEEAEPLGEWPPVGAEPIEIDDLRARLAEAGFDYGEAFQGLDAAWRANGETYAEASLSAVEGGDGFLIHPALLDSAFHPAAVAAGEEMRVPFSFKGISLSTAAPTRLRVRIAGEGEGEDARIELFDDLGAPLGLIEAVSARPFDPAQLPIAAGAPLYALAWERVRATEVQEASAEVEPWRAPETGSAKEATLALLAKLQEFLATEDEDSHLVILTCGAFGTDASESPDPTQAALAGLAGSAASEHPGRVSLIDSDGSDASEAILQAALASSESQLALREGELLAPRLVKAEPGEEEAIELDPERTVLITGATGGLGQLIAKHLIERHGVGHLLLASRSGEEAEGATEMREELEALGARVRIAACDVSDRDQVEQHLSEIDPEHPLGAVIHCAAVLADATVQSASAEQIERVFAPKVDGATNLSELTKELDLTHFVCFSSIAGLFGAAGQGAYAAANRYLDALAQQRSAEGLPATSIAWGLWRREGLSSSLGGKDVARMSRGGIAPLSDDQGLALFDRALASPEALSAALALERGALRARAKTGALPPMLVGIVPRGTAPGGGQGVLARRLRGAPQEARLRLAEDFVRAEVAALLGHSSPAQVGPTDAFKDLGFDSLAAVELRNRLSEAIEARLGSSVVFDYPTVKALAAHLLEQVGEGGPAPAIELSQLERAVAEMAEDDPERGSLASRLRALAGELEGRRAPNGESAATQLEQASDEELLDFIDTQMGGQNGG